MVEVVEEIKKELCGLISHYGIEDRELREQLEKCKSPECLGEVYRKIENYVRENYLDEAKILAFKIKIALAYQILTGW